MGIGAGERTAITRVLVLVSLPLLAAMLWFMFHNPTIHGVPLNSADDGTSVGDWTCLAPYDITLFHASNEYGGNEVADSDYAKAHCDAAGHRSFAVGAIAGALGTACLVSAVVLSTKRRDRLSPQA